MMTTRRPEIQIEGSEDGTNWRIYKFKYKPGDLQDAPCIVAPHQPRLDWQMWLRHFQTGTVHLGWQFYDAFVGKFSASYQFANQQSFPQSTATFCAC